MKRKSDRTLRAALIAMSSLALAAWIARAPFAVEIEAADAGANSPTGPFESTAEAEAFLSRAIPAATAANPKYRSPGSDAWRRWLTKSVRFHAGEDGGVVVSTNETFEDYRDGEPSGGGTHQAEIAIDDVRVSLETTNDVAESGERAQGVLFTCLGAPCIHAVWDGQRSTAASTDIYVQDSAQRERILGALQALQRKGEAR